jgi:hypothetical protein
MSMNVLGKLPPASQVRIKGHLERGELLIEILRASRNGVHVPHLKGALEELQGINDRLQREVDALYPPDEAELARRAADRREEIERKEFQSKVDEALSIFKRTDQLLTDVRVDRRYRRAAEHMVRFAARTLAPNRQPPQVKFTARGYGGHWGFFHPRERDVIYVSEGLDDSELLGVCCHEVSHWSTPHLAGEAGAEYDEQWLAQRYREVYGRDTAQGWVSAA